MDVTFSPHKREESCNQRQDTRDKERLAHPFQEGGSNGIGEELLGGEIVVDR